MICTKDFPNLYRSFLVSWEQGNFIVRDKDLIIYQGPPPKDQDFRDLLYSQMEKAGINYIHGAGLRFKDQKALEQYLKHYPN
tara:strand:+ start:376 stop:621 length:246 start_codon:yes stop_codon:yes gene_type:complete